METKGVSAHSSLCLCLDNKDWMVDGWMGGRVYTYIYTYMYKHTYGWVHEWMCVTISGCVDEMMDG